LQGKNRLVGDFRRFYALRIFYVAGAPRYFLEFSLAWLYNLKNHYLRGVLWLTKLQTNVLTVALVKTTVHRKLFPRRMESVGLIPKSAPNAELA
jgi:hypothetical protein